MAKTESAKPTKGGAEKGRSKHRSPNYPLFDLGKAVELAKKLYDTDKVHKVPIGVVHERWGYKKNSSAGNQAVAAAKSYGLVSVEGTGEQRLIAVTDTGRRIILNAPDRPELLKKAAVGPSLFNSLWGRYRIDGLPSDDVLSHHLIFDRKFNEDIVNYAIDRFKKTVAFAKLVAGDTIEGGGDEEDEESSDDSSESSATSSSSSSSSSRSFDSPPLKPPAKRQMATGFKEDVFSLDEGQVVLQWPDRLSKDSAADLQDWLELIGRKIKRAVQAQQPAADDPGDESDE